MVRAFAPDYIIAPPVVTNPLAGIHIDHQHTAEAVRLVAYQLGVPNAYPTMNAPRRQRFPVPVILNCPDAYSKEALWHFSVSNDDLHEKKVAMLLCHQSQIRDGRPGVEGVGSHAGGLGALGLEVVKVWCLSRGHLHSIRNELSANQLCPLRG